MAAIFPLIPYEPVTFLSHFRIRQNGYINTLLVYSQSLFTWLTLALPGYSSPLLSWKTIQSRCKCENSLPDGVANQKLIKTSDQVHFENTRFRWIAIHKFLLRTYIIIQIHTFVTPSSSTTTFFSAISETPPYQFTGHIIGKLCWQYWHANISE